MKPLKLLVLFSTFITTSFVPQLVAQIAPCAPGTLSQYETAGPCSVGTNLEFGGFTFSASGTGSIPILDTLIEVTPDPQGLGGGFTFSGWQAGVVGPGLDASYGIGYSFAIFGDPPTVDASSIGMDPVTGNVNIGEQICPRGFDCFNESVNSLNPPTDVCDLPGLTAPCWEDTIPLPNLSTAPVTDSITLTGGNSGAGFDDLDNTFHVSDAPEPITWALCFGGLLAIGLVRRYRYIG